MRQTTSFEKTFDNATDEYEKIRPMYPMPVYDDIFRYKPINEESNVLEIGIGTGKAAVPILARGCHLTALEPGENLAQIALNRFAGNPRFKLYTQTFQDYSCEPEQFDLIYAATAFHWVPEEYGYKRVYELLKSGGAFARFAYHAGPDHGRKELTDKIQELYRIHMNTTKSSKVFGEEDAKAIADLADKYGFCDSTYKMYHWTRDFTDDEYLLLLKTYPNHMTLEPEIRQSLFQGIYDAIREYGGIHTIYYTLDLQLARKR